MDTTTDMLKRIIMLLLALAGLADRAANLPLPVRCVVLTILRRAESAGRNLVMAEARDRRAWMLASTEAHGGNGAAEAAGLALSFRLLALALSNLSGPARRFARPLAGLVWPAMLPPRSHRQGRPVAPDTS